ncbi:MAG TPA: ATP-binding cassette domain-containing protein [Gemmatimonadaceae bacterium]
MSTASDRAPSLRLEGITKSFGSTRALDGAGLVVRPATVHAVLGENGAGKTTLMRVAFGMLQPDGGRVLLNEHERRFASPADAIRAGIGMVHQHFTNVAAMTVAENIALGGHGRFSRTSAAARVRAIAAETQLPIDPDARAESLGVGAQQRLEILKALARRARLLIMDEPTAVLAPAEARDLLGWIRSFAAQGGSVILITHKLSEALSVADEVTVLRSGRTVLTSIAGETTADRLAEAMLGAAPPTSSEPETVSAQGGAVLRLLSVTLADDRGTERIVDANLEIRQHEIIGIAALENSGHQLLLRALAGRTTPVRGVLERRGEPALIPEDRHRDALILGFSLIENLALKGAGRRRGRIDWADRRREAQMLMRDYDVRSSSIEAPASSLSGGNQQKLVLARELSGRPPLIVAENPTRGLDIRATAAVHARLRAAAAEGSAVVVFSNDLDEVLALATRVVAVHAGRLREVPNERELVGRAMLGLG